LLQIYFPLPAFALMGKWKLGQHFKSAAPAQNSTFANPCMPTYKPKFAK
jgi:ABC-type transporter MlaC component